jgi:hypothetical protein
MTTTPRSPALPFLAIVALSSFGADGARADDTACKPLVDAQLKYVTTPNHTFTTTTGLLGGDTTQKSETINTGKARFLMVDGQWVVNRMSDQEMLAIEKEKAKGHNLQCRSVRDEPIAGESAALYTVHHVDGKSTSDGQIWISRRSGLPLKIELVLRLDSTHSSHFSSRMSYVDVRAPAGVPQ